MKSAGCPQQPDQLGSAGEVTGPKGRQGGGGREVDATDRRQSWHRIAGPLPVAV